MSCLERTIRYVFIEEQTLDLRQTGTVWYVHEQCLMYRPCPGRVMSPHLFTPDMVLGDLRREQPELLRGLLSGSLTQLYLPIWGQAWCCREPCDCVIIGPCLQDGLMPGSVVSRWLRDGVTALHALPPSPTPPTHPPWRGGGGGGGLVTNMPGCLCPKVKIFFSFFGFK